MGGSIHHHEPFRSLSPLTWTTDLSSGSSEILSDVIADTFSNAHILIDSLPVSPSATTNNSTTPGGRARSQTEPAAKTLDLNHILSTPETKKTVEKLRKEWKEVKTNPRDNPHGITVYKLSAKDGKGAWFGRYSLHHGMEFDKWEACLRREFRETLRRCEREGKEPGCGNIRGIGAERVVERVETPEGLMEVFQVSARFGGPTTARDFIALHMTSPERKEQDQKKKGKEPRQFMLVSRPVEHPDCPPRSGFIRGVYESVEVIREVPVVKPLRRTRSSGDWGEHDGKDGKDGKEAAVRSAKKAIEEGQDGEKEDVEMAIEWLMVTRSDPGGSVPRFMVEKGTPGGIVNDAGQFLKWFASQQEDAGKEQVDGAHEANEEEEVSNTEGKQAEKLDGNGSIDASVLKQLRGTDQNKKVHHHTQGEVTPPSGFYGMIASALGAAGSAVASRVATLAGSTIATDEDSETDDESDTSSELSFASASEGHGADDDVTAELAKNDSNIDAASTLSSVSPSSLHSNEEDGLSVAHTTHSASLSHQHEKELKKLQDRMKKAQAKLERSHQRRHQNHHKEQEEEQKEEAALQRLKEKHEREIAKQKEKYEREVRRLAEKKAQEEKKKEEKRRKQVEREERANMAMELERTRAERDVAKKEIEILRGQVGELQRENTMLVAKLGKLGGEIY